MLGWTTNTDNVSTALREVEKDRHKDVGNALRDRRRQLAQLGSPPRGARQTAEELAETLNLAMALLREEMPRRVLSRLDPQQVENFWTSRKIEVDDWAGLANVMVADTFSSSPDFLVPLEEQDHRFELVVSHVTAHGFLGQLIRGDKLRDDLSKVKRLHWNPSRTRPSVSIPRPAPDIAYTAEPAIGALRSVLAPPPCLEERRHLASLRLPEQWQLALMRKPPGPTKVEKEQMQEVKCLLRDLIATRGQHGDSALPQDLSHKLDQETKIGSYGTFSAYEQFSDEVV